MEISTLIQLFTNLSIFGSSLFIPVIAKEFGANAFEIGVLVSVFYLAFFISNYLFGVLADRFCIRRVVQTGLLASSVFFLVQVYAHDLYSLFWLRLLAGFAAGIFPAALAVYAFEERRGKMGRFNAYASLGWALGSILAGWLAFYKSIFIAGAVFFALSFLISLFLKDICNDNLPALLPWKMIKNNRRIYFPYFMRSFGAQTIWAIFPLYLLATGGTTFWVGVAYFINTFFQFLMMQYVERFKNLYLFNIGLIFSVVAFVLYTVPNFWFILPVQILLAFAFSTLQVGAYQEILAVNKEKATSVGILGSIINFTAVIGPFFAGALLHFFGFQGVMWFGAAAAFIGLISFTKVIK